MSDESTAPDPYELVLADLRSKKSQIEQAIAAIESLRGGQSATGAYSESHAAAGTVAPSVEGPGAFLGMSIVDAAKALLASKRKPMRNPDIALAFKHGGLVLNSKEPANTIGSVLSRRSIEVGDLVKVDRGTWGLKEWYPNRSFKPRVGSGEQPKASLTNEPEQPSEQPPSAGLE